MGSILLLSSYPRSHTFFWFLLLLLLLSRHRFCQLEASIVMAALHSALKVLEPVDFDAIPKDDLKTYLVNVFSSCETLLESVPVSSLDGTPTANRSRSQTVSSMASNASEMSLSSARSAPPSPEHAALQQQWGKAIKPTGKDNPLGMTVYKLPAKDGRGAWFARRSVHEGMGFQKWRTALRHEFPMSLKVQGGPGEGNIRGIGGERRVEEEVVRGIGKMEGSSKTLVLILRLACEESHEDLPKHRIQQC